jgi:hypothetical protein
MPLLSQGEVSRVTGTYSYQSGRRYASLLTLARTPCFHPAFSGVEETKKVVFSAVEETKKVVVSAGHL